MGLPRQVKTAAATNGPEGWTQAAPAVQLTLLDLVRTVGEITDDEAEIVATVLHMLRSGTVKLTGNFRGEPIGRFLD